MHTWIQLNNLQIGLLKYYSVNYKYAYVLELNIVTFDSLIDNSKYMLDFQICKSGNYIVSQVKQIVCHA